MTYYFYSYHRKNGLRDATGVYDSTTSLLSSVTTTHPVLKIIEIQKDSTAAGRQSYKYQLLFFHKISKKVYDEAKKSMDSG